MHGKVIRFGKGWGFIRGDDDRRYYVKSGDIRVPSGFLATGSQVEFRPTTNDKGRMAVDVRPL